MLAIMGFAMYNWLIMTHSMRACMMCLVKQVTCIDKDAVMPVGMQEGMSSMAL